MLPQGHRAVFGAAPDDLENQLLDLRLSWGDLDAVAHELEAAIDDGSATPHQLACYIRLRTPAEASPAAALLDARLASDGLTAESRIELLHAKALILEKSGRHEEAFTTLSNAKAMKRSDYFADDFEAYVTRMVTVMTRGAVTALAAKIGDPDFKPVFIAGVPRSGTTLTEQILSSHSMIGGAGEAGSLGEVLRLLSRSGVGHGDSLEVTMRRVGLDRIARLRDGIRAALRNRTGDAPVVVDKTPQNFMTIHLILALFPQARIIHCFRNPADNFMSAFRLDMTSEHGYAHSPQSYARFYRSYARLMRHWYREFPERIFALDYDALVTDPEPHIRQLLAVSRPSVGGRLPDASAECRTRHDAQHVPGAPADQCEVRWVVAALCGPDRQCLPCPKTTSPCATKPADLTPEALSQQGADDAAQAIGTEDPDCQLENVMAHGRRLSSCPRRTSTSRTRCRWPVPARSRTSCR